MGFLIVITVIVIGGIIIGIISTVSEENKKERDANLLKENRAKGIKDLELMRTSFNELINKAETYVLQDKISFDDKNIYYNILHDFLIEIDQRIEINRNINRLGHKNAIKLEEVVNTPAKAKVFMDRLNDLESNQK